MLSCYLVNCLHLIFFIYIKDLQMGLLTQAEPISDSNKEPNYKKKKKKKKKLAISQPIVKHALKATNTEIFH